MDKKGLGGLGDAPIRVQQIELQRVHQLRPLPQGPDGLQGGQGPLHRRLAGGHCLPAGLGELHLPEGVPAPAGPDPEGVGQRLPNGQIGPAHVGGGGEILTGDQHAVQPGLRHLGAEGLRHGLRAGCLGQPVHKGHHIPLIGVRHQGAAGVGQCLQHQGQHIPWKVPLGPEAVEHPHAVDGGHVHVEDVRQAAHLQRLVPQDGPYQLAHHLPVVAPAPQVHSQAYHLRRLAGRLRREGCPLLEQEQLHTGGRIRQGAAVELKPAALQLHRRPPGLGQRGEGGQHLLRPELQRAGPVGRAEHMAGAVRQRGGGPDAVAEQPEHGVRRPLVLGQERHALEDVPHQAGGGVLIPENGLHHLADDLGVPLVHLLLRHDDEGEVQAVRQLDKLPVYFWHKDAHIEQDQPHLPRSGQPADVGALGLHIPGYAGEAGDHNLASVELVVFKQLVLQGIGVGVLQYGDGGHRPVKPAPSRCQAGVAQAGQLQQIRHRHTHVKHSSPCTSVPCGWIECRQLPLS